jgi:hypothetical protein
LSAKRGIPTVFRAFLDEVISLNIIKQLLVPNCSHIAALKSNMGLASAIVNKIPFIKPTTFSLPVPTFTRVSIAIVFNPQEIIEVIPLDTPRVDYDPITLAQ